MRSKPDIISVLEQPGIIAIIRLQRPELIPPLSEALLGGGITAIEVTLTTPNALEAIRDLRQRIEGRAVVGVGTVLDEDACRGALQAGAQFVVSPVCRKGLVAVAHAAGCPVMLGACTPTEAQMAHEAGADFIKLFPADNLGPRYIKALRAPLPHLRIVPTGGVDAHNIAEFFQAGCAAVGVGSSLLPAKLLQEQNWTELTRRAAELIRAARHSRH
jgi:2-dehydro-3-deoxyphosphogluconate aldolase / (4S)-4-hydroxy-2-oxoglutarate aldolase